MAEPYVVIELPGPPRGKGRPRFSTHGGFARAYTDHKTVAYENLLKQAGITAMAARSLKPLNEAVTVSIRAYMPVPTSWSARKCAAALAGDIAHTTKPDKDNIEKILDGLNYHPPRWKGDKEKRPIVWSNDSQIIASDFMKAYDAQPRLLIMVYRWF